MDFKSAIKGQVLHWRGLSSAESVETSLEALSPVRLVNEMENGARGSLLFRVIEVERDAPPRRVELWVPDGERTVTLIECDAPSVENLEAILADWGPPEWVIEDRRFTQGAVVTEYVYASRGITLSIATPESPTERDRRSVVHVQLYRAISVGEYRNDIAPIGRLDRQETATLRAIENAVAGRLSNWQGLYGFETADAIGSTLEPVRQQMVESERLSNRFHLWIFERTAPPSPVQIWVLFGQNYVTLVEWDEPPIHDLEATLEELGAPDLILEDKRTAAEASVKEYVYAQRGLTISVAEPHSWSERKERRAVHLQLYRSSSLSYYWRYVGPGPLLRPFPFR